MLYNPQWQRDNIFAKSSLIDFLRSHSPEEKYVYETCYACLLAQYFIARGKEHVRVSATDVQWYEDKAHHTCELPDGWNQVAFEGDRTFGAALARARRL